MKLFILVAVVAAYDVSGLSGDYKSTICANQKGYCNSVCGGAANVQCNECSSSTMKFSCQCKNLSTAPAGNVSLSLFPVQTYQCFGEKQECLANCTSQASTFKPELGQSVDLCQYNQCQVKFNCGSANGGEQKSFRVKCGESTGADDDASSASYYFVSIGALVGSLMVYLLVE